MQAQIDIAFDQLVRLAKGLPSKQWAKLKEEVEKSKEKNLSPSDLESFLLSAPTFTKKQLDEIAKTHKAISRWRTK
ncbi:hypothetical protein [Compostibacter hankyongensis]|uniref:Antitoxin n=1 Tax=Compostibacter hankyongensis TaxID=1007089 RepID=A0ABP8FV46_9BACT